MKRYEPKKIEPKWQKYWDEHQTYKVDLNSDKPKYIAMSMFNYPSGAGIHIGHAMNYTISDVLARFKRQQGYESYHPVGWDSFGLPAENYAIKTGVSPQQSMATIIPNYHQQYKAMGWSNDWSKEIASHEPTYYKWTQWIFSQMYKNDLAYQDVRLQWWCTKCQTVLANEQVIDGKCWRHDGKDDPLVEKKEVKQWFFKITEYADELLEAIDDLDWTESVKLAQKNWIGKSKGTEIDFKITDSKHLIKVFTTRPDTLFGATFLVLAPELELVKVITKSTQKAEVEAYIKQTERKSEIERQANKEKTGIFTGAYAINPVNDQKIPIWIADYVLSGYGTGAIMAVPAHDERDNEFAKKYDLPILEVIAPDFGIPLPDAVDVTGPVVVGYDPKTKQYMSLINTKNNMRWFTAGGLEEGETYEQAALRELAEEAGFHKAKDIIRLGGPTYSYFYNPNKNSNRRSFSYMFLAIIDSKDQGKQALESHEKYKVVWTDAATIQRDLEKMPDGRGHWIDGMERAINAVEAWHNNKTYMAPVYTDEGVLFDSGKYNGLSSAVAREKIVSDLTKKGVAKEKTNYKMRDWSVSRQRYWGAPIPIINCNKCGTVLVADKDLPVVLPELDDYAPSGDGHSALARATDWLKVDCPKCGGLAERESDTLDTYIDSSWYMYRYFDPNNETQIFDSEIVKKWEPIDFYNGADHATAHLLYARFIARFFKKLGLVSEAEPFKHFLFNGKVTANDGQMFSKSKGNGIDPLEIIDSGYGADALRTYLMFAAPLDLWVRWDPQGVPGTYRFLSRVWTLVGEFIDSKSESSNIDNSEKVLRVVHATIKKVDEDLMQQKYNTAIAAMMHCTNELYKLKVDNFSDRETWKFTLESLIILVAPFAPHISEELWRELGNKDSVHIDHWPKYEDKYLASDKITLVVQVNGKVRANISVTSDIDEETAVEIAEKEDNVMKYLDKKTVRKVVYVPRKLINFVV